MWEDNKRPSQFVTIDDCIKLALTNLGEEGNTLYNRFKVWCIKGYEELGYDVLNKYKQKYLPVDNSTKTAKLPDDFVQWLRVGTINQGNEINDLTFDANLVFHPIEEEGCNPEPHCSCGCTDPLCAAISSATTTTETITINGTDYEKTTTICTNDSGNISARICEPVVTNPTQACTYSITFPRTASELTSAPYTNFYFTKNNQQLFIGDVTNSAELTTIMTANGFSLTSSGTTSIVYGITLSANVWASATFTNTAFVTSTITFTQSECATPTPTVETYCYDTVICETETLPCGCPVLNNEVVNTIQSWSTLFNEFIQRDLHGLDWQQTFKQPLSWFGYFNVNADMGLIQFDPHYPFDTVYLQYYSANEVTGGDYLVPIFAQDALAAYMIHKFTFNKSNVSGYDKKLYQKAWYNEKKKLHERKNPARMAGIENVIRMNPRP